MLCKRVDQSNGCVILIKTPRGKHIDLLFHEDVKGYHIIKRTSFFRFICEEEFRTYCYGGYAIFDKNIFDKNHIEMWLKFIKENKMNLKFLNKPFPNFNPYEKIIVRNGR